MDIATAAQMRQLDETAIRQRGIPSTQLMETAAAALTQAVMELAREGGRARRAVCLCGAGNNGGDGVACACMLLQAGWKVRCVLVGKREKMTADTAEMARRLADAGGELEDFCPDDQALAAWGAEAGVLVDALFGIGLARPLAGDALAAVEWMNASGVPVVAADIPSGVEADTGRVLGAAVRCAATVTFTGPRRATSWGRAGCAPAGFSWLPSASRRIW